MPQPTDLKGLSVGKAQPSEVGVTACRLGEGSLKGNNAKKQKIFVDQEGGAVIKCPACSLKKATRLDPSVIREKSLRDHCVVRCTCQTRFTVTLEFRRDFRKNSNFSGEYVSLPKGKLRGGMTVVNISNNGIGLQIEGSAQFEIGDQLLVLFTLDGNNDALVEKRATVRYVKNDYIGCEFLGSFPLGKALGNYLISKSDDQPTQAVSVEDQFDWTDCYLK